MLPKDSPKYIQINNAVEYFKNNKISITACSKMFGIHRETLAKYLKQNNLHEDRRSYKINENFFKVIDTEEKAYWLGFITADGGLKSDANILKLRQSKKDTSHLEKFM